MRRGKLTEELRKNLMRFKRICFAFQTVNSDIFDLWHHLTIKLDNQITLHNIIVSHVSSPIEIKSKINSGINLPIGFQITYGGSYAEQQQAFKDLLLILILAAFLVFTVILFLFRRILVSLAIIFISVLGVSGSLLAMLLTGIPLNVGSYTGLIMIIGIIGENSIFTFAQYVSAKKSGLSVDEAIAYSISTRIRPKLMTAIGAIIALFPLALGIGTGAQLHQPLAISIIGGFVLIIPLLLIVLPTLIKIVENFSKNN
mgnify:CR=1 FL=1